MEINMPSVRLPCGCVAFLTVTPKKDKQLDFQIEMNKCPMCANAGEMFSVLRRVSRLETLPPVEQTAVDNVIGKVTG